MNVRSFIFVLFLVQTVIACTIQPSSANISDEQNSVASSTVIATQTQPGKMQPAQPVSVSTSDQVVTPTSEQFLSQKATVEPTEVIKGNSTTEVSVSFSQDILPILKRSCVRCHGGTRTEKKLDLSSYEALMAGSENGAVVIPGDASNSPFVDLVVQGKMPKRGAKLTPDEVQLLIDWVNQGAMNN